MMELLCVDEAIELMDWMEFTSQRRRVAKSVVTREV